MIYIEHIVQHPLTLLIMDLCNIGLLSFVFIFIYRRIAIFRVTPKVSTESAALLINYLKINLSEWISSPTPLTEIESKTLPQPENISEHIELYSALIGEIYSSIFVKDDKVYLYSTPDMLHVNQQCIAISKLKTKKDDTGLLDLYESLHNRHTCNDSNFESDLLKAISS